MYNLTLERLKNLPRRPAEVWEAGVVGLPTPGDDGEERDEHSPFTGACVDARGIAALSEPAPATHLPPTAALDAFESLALESQAPGIPPLQYLPGKVRLTPMPPTWATPMVNAMRALGVGVEVSRDLPYIEDFVAGLAAMMEALTSAPPPPPMPALARGRGMSLERLRAFADAAAAFARARPWLRSHGEVAWEIHPVPKWKDLRVAVVMGELGEQRGLAFLPSLLEFSAMQLRAALQMEITAPRHTAWAVMLDPIDDAPPYDALYWERNDLPLASQDLFPIPVGVTPAGRAVRPKPEQLALMEGLLRLFTEATEEEFKDLRIHRRVPTFDGEVEFELRGRASALDADRRHVASTAQVT